MYKILYLVTAFNVITGTIEQILADSFDDAYKMAYVPTRRVDRVVKLFSKCIGFAAEMITANAVYSMYENGSIVRFQSDGDTEVPRYIVKMLLKGSDGRIFSALKHGTDIKDAILMANNDDVKNAVINEIDYWGVYNINKYGEREKKLKVGTFNSRYQKPEYTLAPSLKVADKYEHYISMMDESEKYLDNYICCLCDREIDDNDYHWLVLMDRYCKTCVSDTRIRASIPMDGIIVKRGIGYIGVERHYAFGFTIW